ncbi:ParB/RepB/Spo0J family partition protein [Dasania sp. GY-MA-18]|uniref:Probable chromosome-partitioning protein ParB n=1 Tax=Dasania phycosphaerae TaxID=2950436 RepID=A0A9J6RIW2_9GAMM|nr:MULTISPECIES: ParB/RepB/Spo0J family partition protein [Dasania]MCR8921975.1 ParB/RepB/Spo0J family partition protein [Dasania sp. GY-MA-18]MCZ0864403.1 ParB/RepB/Spo0J family partition protein [Dasania phycosphaerae]MCZ0868131.1 ParB/RepB/Spo0J family partition protein [Dasania phycosphaerae]
MAKKRGLGRGLNSLINKNKPQATAEADEAVVELAEPLSGDGLLRDLPVEIIQRGKYQPRRDMHPEALEELAASIKTQGVMQPIVVRPIADQRYEIIAGERRWRACQLAGLDKIPALIREVPDEAAIAMALIENIQRENLNAMEEAIALYRLQQEFELSQQEVADAVGKSRSTIANLLRLMNLREDVQRLLEHGDIELGHAKLLLALPLDQQSAAASTIISKGLSVRQTEVLIKQLQSEDAKPSGKAKQDSVDGDIAKLETELSEKIGVPVTLQHGAKGKGKLVLKYNSLDELDGILSHIK